MDSLQYKLLDNYSFIKCLLSTVQADWHLLGALVAPACVERTHMKELITIQEFCERFSVSRTTFYRQRNSGLLPIRKIGRASRIRLADAEAWAASLEQAS